MPDDGSRLPWSDEQWASVQRLVQESAGRARVGSSFLPLVGPLPGGQASVPALTLEQKPPSEEWYGTASDRLDIDDGITKRLTTIACEVFLKTQQADDPELASARQMLSRAAVIIGRLEDAIVFIGQPEADAPPTQDFTRDGPPVVVPNIYTVRSGGTYPGLLPLSPKPFVQVVPAPRADYGNRLVTGVIEAVDELEGRGQYGPFGCVLGHDLYEAAHTPSQGSLVLPSDRFIPFLGGGSLLRSSVLPPTEGVVVASAGSPIDLVVATDVHVGYVQRTTEPRYVLRVSERLVLRVKQPEAIARLTSLPPDGGDANGGGGAETAEE